MYFSTEGRKAWMFLRMSICKVGPWYKSHSRPVLYIVRKLGITKMNVFTYNERIFFKKNYHTLRIRIHLKCLNFIDSIFFSVFEKKLLNV